MVIISAKLLFFFHQSSASALRPLRSMVYVLIFYHLTSRSIRNPQHSRFIVWGDPASANYPLSPCATVYFRLKNNDLHLKGKGGYQLYVPATHIGMYIALYKQGLFNYVRCHFSSSYATNFYIEV